ncbi:M67 family metallopeptidase [Sphingomonas sp. S2-65]|uniref:M67 family metallopeptidase n=1 Tax=Sphingomonas sp. S2-65 TaxID=2903960 RepID=UPI001F25C161|nr:M67 family metallopeptidase [Sphingomonas sp. S2-65]UYY58723.1 M67 family metallopeptidase [Sphingomonas sp. S2-65]
MGCRISRSLLDAIRQESAIVAPEEACGLLFGTTAQIDGWTPARNVAEQPERRFEIDPATLFAALRAERTGGAALIGYWHSHPSGDPTPSRTDGAMAQPDGKLWLILGSEFRLWQAGKAGLHGRFEEVPIEID